MTVKNKLLLKKIKYSQIVNTIGQYLIKFFYDYNSKKNIFFILQL
ncbi:hypothetical protein K661_02262 [Piscirickettsia salmonis LF-89 = ATCC VR-1361]|nr:hypothetical protein K661_02262 [Piscirickettsia salmonis LF-89 = ATCC VR-1361]